MSRRKYARILIMFACGAALLLAVGGCRKKPSAPPVEPAPTEPTAAEPTPTEPTAAEPAPTEPTVAEPAPTEPPETSGTPVPPDTAPTPPGTVEDEMQVVPLVGVGPVKFGMSRGQVMEVLGQPERTEGGGVAIYYLTSKGVHFLIDPRRGVRSIECWSAQYPRPFPGMVTFSGKTDKGIGMGASRQEIVAAYGDPERVDSEGLLENLRYSQLRMTFVLTEGRLVNLKVGGP
ncbi:MAG: hypothetical protein ACYST6_00995 [Planctomycetota bacterium]